MTATISDRRGRLGKRVLVSQLLRGALRKTRRSEVTIETDEIRIIRMPAALSQFGANATASQPKSHLDSEGHETAEKGEQGRLFGREDY